MKRVFGAVFAMLLALALALPLARADGELALSVSAVSGRVGDTVVVKVSSVQALAERYLDSVQFDLVYDSAVLQMAGAAADETFLNNFTVSINASAPGVVRFAAASATGNNSAGGTLLEVRFKILSETASTLTLKNISYSTRDSGYQSQTATLPEQTAAAVTVLPATAAPTATPTATPTAAPTATPKATAKATAKPTTKPTATAKPTASPTAVPPLTVRPTGTPTATPTATPTVAPTSTPTQTPEVFVITETTGVPATPEPEQAEGMSGLTGFILVLCGLGLVAVVVIIVITLKRK